MARKPGMLPQTTLLKCMRSLWQFPFNGGEERSSSSYMYGIEPATFWLLVRGAIQILSPWRDLLGFDFWVHEHDEFLLLLWCSKVTCASTIERISDNSVKKGWQSYDLVIISQTSWRLSWYNQWTNQMMSDGCAVIIHHW